MINRRYFLVVLDPSGRSVRRFSVSRQLVQGAALAGVLAVLGLLATLAHGLWQHGAAREAEQLARENAMLREIEAQLAHRLDHGRTLALQAELTFAQIWSKSGLGLSPRMLGIGPTDDDTAAFFESDDDVLKRPFGGHVMSVEAAALPLELDRIFADGMQLQQSLGELLEYFHDAALLLSNTPSVRPVTKGYLTSQFGKRRDPMHGQWVMHKGLDFGGRTGLEINAPADGVVIYAGPRGGYGNTIVIDHGYGLQTHYAHMSRFRTRRGERVRRGDLIGEMGNTGRSTGPHLHYEVRRNGHPLNPIRFVLD